MTSFIPLEDLDPFADVGFLHLHVDSHREDAGCVMVFGASTYAEDADIDAPISNSHLSVGVTVLLRGGFFDGQPLVESLLAPEASAAFLDLEKEFAEPSSPQSIMAKTIPISLPNIFEHKSNQTI